MRNLTLAEAAQFSQCSPNEYGVTVFQPEIAIVELRTKIGNRLALRRDLILGAKVFLAVLTGGALLMLAGVI